MITRTGITRVDAIIVQVIVVLLVGLQAPLVQKIRDAANRTKSTNNLKLLGLAMLNYNDSLGRLPQLTDAAEGGFSGTGRCSVFFSLLPYIEKDFFEQHDVFQTFDKSSPTSYEQPAVANKNSPPARQLIKPFISPADDSAPNGTTIKVNDLDLKPPIKNAEYATCSYAANGIVFGQPGAALPRTFQDGESNTIVFAERYQVCSDGKSTIHNLWALASVSPSLPSFAYRPKVKGKETGQFTPNDNVPADGEVFGETKAGLNLGKIAYASLKVSGGKTGFQIAPAKNECDARVPQTPHKQGMLVTLGDGSVRTLAPTIRGTTFFAAVTPAGNESLGADWDSPDK